MWSPAPEAAESSSEPESLWTSRRLKDGGTPLGTKSQLPSGSRSVSVGGRQSLRRRDVGNLLFVFFWTRLSGVGSYVHFLYLAFTEIVFFGHALSDAAGGG